MTIYRTAVLATAMVILAGVLARPGLSQDRVPGSVIADRIAKRMETRRLERVPRLTSSEQGGERIGVGGQFRSFLRYTPNAVLVGGKKAPVVFVLHGASGSAEQIQRYLGLNAVAEREGFIAVYPQGLNNRWNDGRAAADKANGETSTADDVAFLAGLADALVVQGVADPKRIYVAGVSNGGFMALRMACHPESRFAAYAAVIASLASAIEPNCKPGHAVPLVMINGTADELIRTDGKPGRWGIKGYLAPLATAKLFASISGCKGERSVPLADPKDGTSATVTIWGGCEPGGAVELYTIAGGGHQAPAKAKGLVGLAMEPIIGRRSRAIDTAETVWDFFKRF